MKYLNKCIEKSEFETKINNWAWSIVYVSKKKSTFSKARVFNSIRYCFAKNKTYFILEKTVEEEKNNLILNLFNWEKRGNLEFLIFKIDQKLPSNTISIEVFLKFKDLEKSIESWFLLGF